MRVSPKTWERSHCETGSYLRPLLDVRLQNGNSKNGRRRVASRAKQFSLKGSEAWRSAMQRLGLRRAFKRLPDASSTREVPDRKAFLTVYGEPYRVQGFF